MSEAHFLRPALTKHIIQRLQRGESLNLFGKTGIGKTRMIEDVRKANLPNTIVISVSFRGYEDSYAGFCQAIWAGSELSGNLPPSFNETIEKIVEKGKCVFLLIDDFQAILKNPDIDPAYNQDFVNALNAVRNMRCVSLMVVSEKPANSLILFINKEPRTSVLNLNPIKIDELSQQGIQKELNRRFKKDNLADDEKNLLASFLNNHKRNYEFLEYITPKIIINTDADIEFRKRLVRWYKEFKKRCSPSFMKWIVKIIKWIKTWLIIVPVGKIINKIKAGFSLLEDLKNLIISLKTPK